MAGAAAGARKMSTTSTGNGIAERCRFVLNYHGFTVNEAVENDWCFCKTDYLDEFFADHAPRTPFVLFSANSDYPIDGRYERYLRRRRLKAWFAMNVELDAPKLHPIPIGLANPHWPHGDTGALKRVQRSPAEKSRLFDTSFSVATNPAVRRYCLEQTGLVERQDCPGDLRVTYARLTDAGAERLAAASCAHVRSIRALFEEHLSDTELDELADLLERLPGVAGTGPPCLPA